jgi:hypothetical protein
MIRRALDSYWLGDVLNALLFLAALLAGFAVLHIAAHILFYGSPVGSVVDSILDYN